MNLPRGITGFREEGAPLPSTNDLKLFRSVCHDASRRLGGKVISSEDAYSRQTNNFAILTIAMPEKKLAVLLHAHFPVVGFAEPLPSCQQTIHFVDAPDLAEAVNAAGHFEVFSREELELPITPDAVEGLADVELEQIRYWKPRRIGEIIFNLWD